MCDDPYLGRPPTYQRILGLAFPSLLLWPLGVPALFLALLVCCRPALLHGQPSALVRAVSWLHCSYTPGCYAWEVVDMIRKVLLTGGLLLIPSSLAFVRLLIATVVSLCHLVSLLAIRPYKSALEQQVAVASSLSLLMILLASLVTLLHQIASSDVSSAAAEAILGFSSISPLVGVMAVANVAMFVLVLGELRGQLSRESRTKLIRLRSTKLPPELVRPEAEMRWHTFVRRSHSNRPAGSGLNLLTTVCIPLDRFPTSGRRDKSAHRHSHHATRAHAVVCTMRS